MEDDRAQVDLGVAVDIEEKEEEAAALKQPRKRFVGRRQAEEAASKTKIKIIFPLVLCIFPCLFIVLLAPAVLNIMSGLQGMNK